MRISYTFPIDFEDMMLFKYPALMLAAFILSISFNGIERVLADNSTYTKKQIDEPVESIKPKKEQSDAEDASSVDSEIKVKKPLDLTIKPNFSENLIPYKKRGINSGFNTSDMFKRKKTSNAIKLKGELIRVDEEEQEKIRAVDGVGIIIELNPK